MSTTLKEPAILSQKYPAKSHLRKVTNHLKTHDPTFNPASVLYAHGATSRLWPNCDQAQPFRQNRAFFYLSGCDIPDASIAYDVQSDTSTLFIPPVVDDEVIWSGLPLSPEEALEKYDVDAVRTSKDVNHLLNSKETGKGQIYALAEDVPNSVTSLNFEATDMVKLRDAIDECRVVKDEYEIALIRHANALSNIAHRAVLAAAKTASNERQLAALFVERCTAHGAFNQAYDPIVASGTDAATLHYVRNNKAISGATLNLLIDAGAEYQCYASDVTRTFPINGKFTKESREIYGIVFEMQRRCMGMLKAGVDWDEVHMLAHRIAAEGLVRLGILKGATADVVAARTTTLFFPHGLGHYMGLDTHDTGGHPNYEDTDTMFRYLRKRGTLPANSIITVEPGIYFCRFIIEPQLKNPTHAQFIDREVLERYWAVGGVRIEDDVLITENGYENLTEDLPRDMESLEKLMT
ncbi:MAG: hypothetical protein Q9162_001451 [Coniocarpon cinnabarinum]